MENEETPAAAACSRPMPTTAPSGHRAALRLGEGLVGQCAVDKRRMLITDMPDERRRRSARRCSRLPPRNIIVLPVLFEDQVKAVIELASLSAFTDLAD